MRIAAKACAAGKCSSKSGVLSDGYPVITETGDSATLRTHLHLRHALQSSPLRLHLYIDHGLECWTKHDIFVPLCNRRHRATFLHHSLATFPPASLHTEWFTCLHARCQLPVRIDAPAEAAAQGEARPNDEAGNQPCSWLLRGLPGSITLPPHEAQAKSRLTRYDPHAQHTPSPHQIDIRRRAWPARLRIARPGLARNSMPLAINLLYKLVCSSPTAPGPS